MDKILSRLSGVTKINHNQWLACCPAHDDKRPSLGIKLCDNGYILMKCWSGICGIDDIVDAMGLDMSDLFPAKCTPDYSGKAKREYFDPATVLQCLQNEAIIIRLTAEDMVAGYELTADDIRRVKQAENRISQMLTYCFKFRPIPYERHQPNEQPRQDRHPIAP